MKREHFDHFFIAGFTYYEGVMAFEQMKIGTELNIKLEPGNKHDSKAVAIYFNEYKLGYVPRANNKAVYAILKSGVDILEARVQTLSPDMPPEQQIQVVVFSRINKKKQ
jgi:hypothetical protein